jgi:hypothetical protein
MSQKHRNRVQQNMQRVKGPTAMLHGSYVMAFGCANAVKTKQVVRENLVST